MSENSAVIGKNKNIIWEFMKNIHIDKQYFHVFNTRFFRIEIIVNMGKLSFLFLWKISALPLFPKNNRNQTHSDFAFIL